MSRCPFLAAVADDDLDRARDVALAGDDPADEGTIPTLIGMARVHLLGAALTDVGFIGSSRMLRLDPPAGSAWREP